MTAPIKIGHCYIRYNAQKYAVAQSVFILDKNLLFIINFDNSIHIEYEMAWAPNPSYWTEE